MHGRRRSAPRAGPRAPASAPSSTGWRCARGAGAEPPRPRAGPDGSARGRRRRCRRRGRGSACRCRRPSQEPSPRTKVTSWRAYVGRRGAVGAVTLTRAPPSRRSRRDAEARRGDRCAQLGKDAALELARVEQPVGLVASIGHDGAREHEAGDVGDKRRRSAPGRQRGPLPPRPRSRSAGPTASGATTGILPSSKACATAAGRLSSGSPTRPSAGICTACMPASSPKSPTARGPRRAHRLRFTAASEPARRRGRRGS